MSVSAADVDELRREGQAMLARGAENELRALQTAAEVVGYLIYSLKAEGVAEEQQLDAVEVVLRAAELDRADIREVRDVLRTLRFAPAHITRLTVLAKKARPRPPPRIRPPNSGRPGAPHDGQQPAPSSLRAEGEAEAALRMLRPVKGAPRR